MKQKKLLTPTSGVSGGGILDKNLVPRITNYAMNHSISDLDEVAEGLRSTYRDYQRWKMPTLWSPRPPRRWSSKPIKR